MYKYNIKVLLHTPHEYHDNRALLPDPPVVHTHADLGSERISASERPRDFPIRTQQAVLAQFSEPFSLIFSDFQYYRTITFSLDIASSLFATILRPHGRW